MPTLKLYHLEYNINVCILKNRELYCNLVIFNIKSTHKYILLCVKEKNNELKEHAQILAVNLGADQQSNNNLLRESRKVQLKFFLPYKKKSK